MQALLLEYFSMVVRTADEKLILSMGFQRDGVGQTILDMLPLTEALRSREAGETEVETSLPPVPQAHVVDPMSVDDGQDGWVEQDGDEAPATPPAMLHVLPDHQRHK